MGKKKSEVELSDELSQNPATPTEKPDVLLCRTDGTFSWTIQPHSKGKVQNWAPFSVSDL